MSRAEATRAAGLAALTAALLCGAAPPASASTPAPAGVKPSATASAVAAPTARAAWRARIVAATPMHSTPDPDSDVRGTISPTGAWNGGSVYLLVLDVAYDEDGERWLRVELPSRPNERSAWVLASRVAVSRVRWRVEISRATRRASAYRDGHLMRSWPVVVGTGATPTPTGLFAVYERVRQPAGSELGPWVLHLTAHSDTLFNYGGGPGRVALHGRAGALLDDPLGTASSHGCVRMDDAVIDWLAARLAPGTPVRVR